MTVYVLGGLGLLIFIGLFMAAVGEDVPKPPPASSYYT